MLPKTKFNIDYFSENLKALSEIPVSIEKSADKTYYLSIIEKYLLLLHLPTKISALYKRSEDLKVECDAMRGVQSPLPREIEILGLRTKQYENTLELINFIEDELKKYGANFILNKEVTRSTFLGQKRRAFEECFKKEGFNNYYLPNLNKMNTCYGLDLCNDLLTFAIKNQRMGLMDALVEAEVDMNQPLVGDKRPLDLALEGPPNLPLIEQLTKGEAALIYPGNIEASPLLRYLSKVDTCKKENLEIIKHLLDQLTPTEIKDHALSIYECLLNKIPLYVETKSKGNILYDILFHFIMVKGAPVDDPFNTLSLYAHEIIQDDGIYNLFQQRGFVLPSLMLHRAHSLGRKASVAVKKEIQALKADHPQKLFHLMANGNVTEALQLIDNFCKDEASKSKYINGETLLSACKFGHYLIVKKLIEEKVDIQYQDQYKQNALTLAIQDANQDIALLLLDKGYKSSNDGETLLSACKFGHYRIVKKLIEEKVDIQYQDQYKQNALTLAIQSGNQDIALLLLDKGYKSSNDGETLLWACKFGHYHIVKKLIEEKVDIQYQDQYKQNALTLAIQSGNQDIALLLLGHDYKSPSNFKDDLALAKQFKQSAVVGTLTYLQKKSVIEDVAKAIDEKIEHFTKNGKAFFGLFGIGNKRKAKKISEALERAKSSPITTVDHFLNDHIHGEESILEALDYHRIGFFGHTRSYNDIVKKVEEINVKRGLSSRTK